MPTTVLSRQRSWIAILAVLAMIASLMAFATPAQAAVIDTSSTCPSSTPSAGFTDIGGLPADNQLAINCIADYGITKGIGGNLYGPLGNVPRWQMALFLTRELTVQGVTLPDGSSQNFTDIGGHNAETQKAINQLAQLGISVGRTATTFVPDDNVTREEMALFIARKLVVAGVTLADPPASGGFVDISTLGAESQKAINQLENAGVVQGVGQNKYVPSASIIRANMAFFEARALATDGILPPGTSLTDMPELLSVSEKSYDADDDELVLVFNFDEAIDFVDEVENFRVYEANHAEAVPEHEGDSSSVNGSQVTVTFEDISGSEYDDLTVATVAAEAVEDLGGDQNPEGSAPYKSATIGISAGALDGHNLEDVTHDDSGAVDGAANFIFKYDDETLDADGDILDPFGGFIIIRDNGVEVVCDFFADSDTDADLDDDEINIECPGAVIPSDEWDRALDDGGVIEFTGLVVPMWQVVDEASTDAPDLNSVEQVGNVRVEFVFDERLKFFDGEDDTDDSTAVDEATILAGFAIYDDEGEVINPIRAIVTDSDRVVRLEFDPFDVEDIGDGDDDLDGDLEGGIISAGIVEERSGDEDPNLRDEARTGSGADFTFAAGTTAGADLVSVGDVVVSDTDISGDADEWEAVFTFSEDVGVCDPDSYRLYDVDGDVVNGDTCDVDDEEVTVQFIDSDVEDAVLGGVAFGAGTADDNGQAIVEGSGPTKFAG